MGFAVRYVQHALRIKDAVRTRELAGEWTLLGAVSPLAGTERRRNNSGFQVNAPDSVALGVRHVETVGSIDQPLGPREFRIQRRAAITAVALLARARDPVE